MSEIFDETNMRQTLGKYISNGETLLAGIQEVISDILLADIGTCFPLADIQSCEIKKGWMGSVKCLITMKNGSYFKLMFPKLGGLGGGMRLFDIRLSPSYCNKGLSEYITVRMGGVGLR